MFTVIRVRGYVYVVFLSFFLFFSRNESPTLKKMKINYAWKYSSFMLAPLGVEISIYLCIYIYINQSRKKDESAWIDIAGIRCLDLVKNHCRRGPHGEGRGQDTTGGGLRLGCLRQDGSGGPMPMRCVLCWCFGYGYQRCHREGPPISFMFLWNF